MSPERRINDPPEGRTGVPSAIATAPSRGAVRDPPVARRRARRPHSVFGPGDPAGADGDAALRTPAGQGGGPDAEVRPHVELDLLGQPQPVVEQGREPVAGPGPGFDLEAEGVAVRLGAELDF